MNILEAYSSLGYSYKHKHGTEYGAAICPFCGEGTDRVIMWLDDKTPNGRYFCRRCRTSCYSPEIFLQYVDENRTADADSSKPGSNKSWASFAPRRSSIVRPVAFDPITNGGYLYMVQEAPKKMSPLAVNYLKSRGITTETAKKLGLGFFPENRTYTPIIYHGVVPRLPIGIVIPNKREGSLYSVKVRCLDNFSSAKYQVLACCKQMPYVLKGSERKNLPVLITESELDAILLWQELQDRFSYYIALGSSNNGPNDSYVRNILGNAASVLFVPDNDEAGFAAYAEWKQAFSKIRLAQLPIGKDPTEAYLRGFDFTAWAKGLRFEKGVTDKPAKPDETPTAKLNAYEELLAYIAGLTHVVIDYNTSAQEFSFSNGSDIVTYSGKIEWSDFSNITVVAENPEYIHRDVPECPLILDSPIYLHHALTGKTESLAKLTVSYLGVRHPADLAALVNLFKVLYEKFESVEDTSDQKIGVSNAYIVLKGSQLAVGQIMGAGLPLNREIYSAIPTESKVDYASYVKEDGRIHPIVDVFGTVTGRFSVKMPSLYSLPNAQKAAVVAPEGFVFVDADFRQSEMRIAAELSKELTLLSMLNDGFDCHSHIAEMVFGKAEGEQAKINRSMAKAVNFGHLYGETSKNIINKLVKEGVLFDPAQVEHFYNDFPKMFPELYKWKEATRKKLTSATTPADCYVSTTLARRINLVPLGWKWKTCYINYCIQGSGADLLLASLTLLPKHIKGLNVRVVLTVHDEILLEVAKQDAEQALHALTTAMEEAYVKIFNSDHYENLVDAHIGKTWLEAKQG